MLNIQNEKHLGCLLGVDPGAINRACDLIEDDVSRKQIGSRDVISVTGETRRLQTRLLNRVFRNRLRASVANHGGVSGRSIKSNALCHKDSSFILKCDIRRFYPSIGVDRLARRFTELGCPIEVTRRLTRLCSFDHHLALGLVTSPILADSILHKVDKRISHLVSAYSLTYTRFVDDVTVSGNYDFISKGIADKLAGILKDHGFDLSPKQPDSISGSKRFWYGPIRNAAITGVRLRPNGRLDITDEYARELERILEDHARFSRGEPLVGEFFDSSSIEGKIRFVRWVNPGRAPALWQQFNRINWTNIRSIIRGEVGMVPIAASSNAPF